MAVDQIVACRAGLAGKARREELMTQLYHLKLADKEPDYAMMLRERQQYEAQLAVWADQVEEYEAWEKEKSEMMIRLAMLDVDLQQHPILSQALDQARAYEQYVKIYGTQLEDYNRVAGQIVAYRADAEDWKRSRRHCRSCGPRSSSSWFRA
jgi:hypothetical protein